jgi:hypothetical protein
MLWVDSFLTVLFAVCLIGFANVWLGGADDFNILIFAVVIGVPYGLLRFVSLGSPIPFTALPKRHDQEGHDQEAHDSDDAA